MEKNITILNLKQLLENSFASIRGNYKVTNKEKSRRLLKKSRRLLKKSGVNSWDFHD